MDIWYYSRKTLAEQYLKVFDTGIWSNLAIIAPRRKGKTLFMLNDVSSLAQKKKYLPVYASLWQNTNAPHEGIILALQEALSSLEKKLSFSRILNTKVKKATLGNELIGNMEIEFADSPQQPGNADLVLIDQLITQLQHKAKNKTLLLLIDEVQHLATSEHFNALTHALRTMLDKRAGKVKAIFTGSSRHYMNLLFNESLSPFYHFVETLPFPDLDDGFIDFLADRFKTKHKKILAKRDLQRIFTGVDQSPYWMMKIISHVITFDETLDNAFDYVLELMESAEGFKHINSQLKPIDRLVFLAIGAGRSPFSKALLEKIDAETSLKGVYANVQRSLKRLIQRHLVTQITKGEYEIEKPGFKEYLIKNTKPPRRPNT